MKLRETLFGLISLVTISSMVSACASQRTQSAKVIKTRAGQGAKVIGQTAGKVPHVINQTGRSVPGALKAPLDDLNLTKSKMPPVLANLPYLYRVDGPVYCDKLMEEINALNAVLGPDEDIRKIKLSTAERAAESASNSAQNALEDAATGWIPYRSLVRRISGATKREREIRKAYEKGRIRRAFLKGVGGAFKCPYPAAPSSVQAPVKIGAN